MDDTRSSPRIQPARRDCRDPSISYISSRTECRMDVNILGPRLSPLWNIFPRHTLLTYPSVQISGPESSTRRRVIGPCSGCPDEAIYRYIPCTFDFCINKYPYNYQKERTEVLGGAIGRGRRAQAEPPPATKADDVDVPASV